MHGVVMYGAYIALFGGSLCAAAAAPTKDEGDGALSMDAGDNAVAKSNGASDTSAIEVVAASRAVRGSPLTVSALIRACADSSAYENLPCGSGKLNSAAGETEHPCGTDVAWMSEKLCVPEGIKASAWAATGVLIRTIAIGAVGIMCVSNLGTAIGVLVLAYCLSSLYVIGQDCAKAFTFRRSWPTMSLERLCCCRFSEPLQAVKKNVAANEAFYRRAAAKLFGDVSVSSLCVWSVLAGAAAFVAHRGVVSGMWMLSKYWLLPLLIMHINVRTFESSTKGGRNAHNVLFPELSLHKYLSEITSRSYGPKGKLKRRRKKRASAAVAVLSAIKKEFSHLQDQLEATPLYHLSEAAAHVRSRVTSRMRFIATHELALSAASRKSGSMSQSDSSSCSSDENTSDQEIDSVLAASRGDDFLLKSQMRFRIAVSEYGRG